MYTQRRSNCKGSQAHGCKASGGLCQSITNTHVALSPGLLTVQIWLVYSIQRQRGKAWRFFVRDDIYLAGQKWGGGGHFAKWTPSPLAVDVQDRTSLQNASPCLPRKTLTLFVRWNGSPPSPFPFLYTVSDRNRTWKTWKWDYTRLYSLSHSLRVGVTPPRKPGM